MNVRFAQMLTWLAQPLKALDVRSQTIERWLELPLSCDDVAHLRERTGCALGAYYHWYLQKMLVATAIKGASADRARAFLAATDRTDYSPAQALLDSPTGVIVAIPHHAHYILTMTALAMRVGKTRKVNVFYASPKTNQGNAVFDQLHSMLFSDPASGVDVIHNTRQGLAKAIKGLKRGEVVFIMPDAYADVAATMMYPFCGALQNAMQGTAAMARKTGAWIQPLVSKVEGNGLAFGARFGAPIEVPSNALDGEDQERIVDYAVMRKVFSAFEESMAGELVLWQNILQHGRDTKMPAHLAPFDDLTREVEHLGLDPLFRAPDLVVDLRGFGGAVTRSA